MKEKSKKKTLLLEEITIINLDVVKSCPTNPSRINQDQIYYSELTNYFQQIVGTTFFISRRATQTESVHQERRDHIIRNWIFTTINIY